MCSSDLARFIEFEQGQTPGASSSNTESVYKLSVFDTQMFTKLTLSGTPDPTLIVNHSNGGVQITGNTSGATATILVEDSRNLKLYISSQQKFITDETFTGTNGAQGKLTNYRANPIQNIQQLLEYADVDNTIFDFLDQMRSALMTSIPNALASSVSKRKLLKNIKDLYSAKGTREGHELFFRILLGEEANIFYPTEHMLRVSNGDWRAETILRCSGFAGVSGDEIINQKITAQTSGATAIVNDAITFQEGTQSVTELELANIDGVFQDGETITANSTVRDRSEERRVGKECRSRWSP